MERVDLNIPTKAAHWAIIGAWWGLPDQEVHSPNGKREKELRKELMGNVWEKQDGCGLMHLLQNLILGDPSLAGAEKMDFIADKSHALSDTLYVEEDL